MNPAMDFVKQAKLFVLENTYARKVDIRLNKAIFSFTFDDAPISAATTGADILERFKATGTFYLAMGMEESDKNKRFFIGEPEIAPLVEKGHQIGCHTYSHLNLAEVSVANACNDCDRNTQILNTLLGAPGVEHFAYPLGKVSLSCKKIFRHKYTTLRSTTEGLNVGLTDMSYLKSFPIYSSKMNKARILAAIQQASKTNAWLIFYTHDISDKPTPWGATEEDFRWVVEQCANNRGDILNIGEAYNRINHS